MTSVSETKNNRTKIQRNDFTAHKHRHTRMQLTNIIFSVVFVVFVVSVDMCEINGFVGLSIAEESA